MSAGWVVAWNTDGCITIFTEKHLLSDDGLQCFLPLAIMVFNAFSLLSDDGL
jgi:hypothetical protein